MSAHILTIVTAHAPARKKVRRPFSSHICDAWRRCGTPATCIKTSAVRTHRTATRINGLAPHRKHDSDSRPCTPRATASRTVAPIRALSRHVVSRPARRSFNRSRLRLPLARRKGAATTAPAFPLRPTGKKGPCREAHADRKRQSGISLARVIAPSEPLLLRFRLTGPSGSNEFGAMRLVFRRCA